MKKTLFIIFAILISNISVSQIDSTYYYKCEKILKNYPKSRISAKDLYNAQIYVYEKYNIEVPCELAISQAIIETSLGNSGVGKSRNNPYSINSKNGYKRYVKIYDGVLAYYDLMSRRYLKCKTVDEILYNFRNCKGGRYATSNSYTYELRKVYYKLKKMIE